MQRIFHPTIREKEESLSDDKMKPTIFVLYHHHVIHCRGEPEAVAPIGRIRGSVLTSRRFIPSAVWNTPSHPQENDVFRWVFFSFFFFILRLIHRVIFINPGKILACGHLSNLSSAFNRANKGYSPRVSFYASIYGTSVGIILIIFSRFRLLFQRQIGKMSFWRKSKEGPSCPNLAGNELIMNLTKALLFHCVIAWLMDRDIECIIIYGMIIIV